MRRALAARLRRPVSEEGTSLCFDDEGSDNGDVANTGRDDNGAASQRESDESDALATVDDEEGAMEEEEVTRGRVEVVAKDVEDEAGDGGPARVRAKRKSSEDVKRTLSSGTIKSINAAATKYRWAQRCTNFAGNGSSGVAPFYRCYICLDTDAKRSTWKNGNQATRPEAFKHHERTSTHKTAAIDYDGDFEFPRTFRMTVIAVDDEDEDPPPPPRAKTGVRVSGLGLGCSEPPSSPQDPKKLASSKGIAHVRAALALGRAGRARTDFTGHVGMQEEAVIQALGSAGVDSSRHRDLLPHETKRDDTTCKELQELLAAKINEQTRAGMRKAVAWSVMLDEGKDKGGKEQLIIAVSYITDEDTAEHEAFEVKREFLSIGELRKLNSRGAVTCR
jgi:hypothetical protein